jgi:glycerophosphoryl diester phosphodiesterase
MKTKILAHRGASAYAPENTVEAFALAMEQGADGFELDVHLDDDGEVVVAHDIPTGGGSPFLRDVYSLVKNTNHIINVELKTTERLYPEMPAKLISLEREFNMCDRVIYSSFNHYSLLELRKHSPEAKIGLLYNMGLIDPWIYARHVKADAIHPYYTIVALLPETVAKCHEHGIAVNVWTVDDPGMIDIMLKYNVDSIITNKPDLAAERRNKK